MIRTLALIAAACAGCFHPVYEQVRCGTDGACPSGSRCMSDLCLSGALPGDAAPGGGSSNDGGIPGCTSLATLVNTCPLSFEDDLIVDGNASYDTDKHLLIIGGTSKLFALKTVMIGADPVDVISAHDVHLETSAVLRAIGSHGLVIVASNDFLIDDDAQIDVSNSGAGARTSCPNGAMKGQDNNNGAGGGGGGSYGDHGGDGGDGNHDGTPGQGGLQGRAETAFPTGFHGGCPGADGGTGDVSGGAGGKAGGALYVVAGRRMVFTSLFPLNAGGAGGKGGGHLSNNGDAGGGGGGSGGLLILEAPHIVTSGAIIAANGGAGGEGSDRNSGGGDGEPGAVSNLRASGGAGGAVTGSDGGDGGSVDGTVGLSVTENADGGGGGGGGGVGFIRVRSPDSASLATSPNPS